jgi:predicted DCC family thiol-disulfide oxidoreductase YuxK
MDVLNDLLGTGRPAMSTDFDIEVFFDGECPICRREIAFLRRLDRRQRIRFTDIAPLRPHDLVDGIPWPELMAELHGRLPDGRWIKGVEVFRRLYAAVGFDPLVSVSRWVGIEQILDAAYAAFARRRLRWTNRCNTSCRAETPS